MDDLATPLRPVDERPPISEEAIRNRIARAIRRARLALWWETLWPRLVPPLAVVGLFLAVSWFGLWIGMPEWLRVTLLATFGVALLVSLIPLARMRRPDLALALARVERATGVMHRPASGVLDRLGAQQDDPLTQALWAAHRQRLLAGFGRLKAGVPSPGVARRDPYALRFLVILIAVVGLLFAGTSLIDRLGDAFRGGGTATAAAVIDARIDAWAAPPDYTARPPIFLTGATIRVGDGPIAVPEGTVVIVRVSDRNAGLEAFQSEGAGPLTAVAPVEGEAGPLEYRAVLAASGVVAVREGPREVQRWAFEVIPDEAPVVAFTADPEVTEAGALRLAYEVHDDYGIVAARGDAVLTIVPAPGARPLVGPPELALNIPGTRDGEAVTVKDVAVHPWAGMEVQLTLVVTDARGQEGRTDIRTIVLPERSFTHPISIALVDERRNLALDARVAPHVASALDLLTLAPEFFIGNIGEFLVLRSAYYRLQESRSDPALLRMVDYLWEIAVGLEGDVVADAATAAQAALDALREALERNATEAEIAELTEELREAMRDYLAALAERGPLPEGLQQETPEIMEGEELDAMLEAVREMAGVGNTDGAQQLLDQLQQMMENMAAAPNVNDLQQQQEQQQQQAQADAEALQQLGDVIEQQQQLRDETFGLMQQQNAPMPTPRTEEETRQLLEQLRGQREEQRAQAGDLQQRQEQLQRQLEELFMNLDEVGMGDPALDAAGEHMGIAADELAGADAATAVIEQGAALENLRGGAEAMIQRILERRSMQVQRTETGAGGNDPLGRPLPTDGPDYGNDVRVPEEIDRQRARIILEIIRQKLGEPGRPEVEMDYLQRLLNAL